MKFRVVVLAAGKGKRMNADIPKALIPVGGKPILEHLFENIRASGLDPKPIVVIGHEGQRICDSFNGNCDYAIQEKQLGTGDAVRAAEPIVGQADTVIVLYGDHPFISSQTIKKLAKRHEERGNTITMMTTVLPSFQGWYQAFYHWSRILRGSNGHIIGDRQFKDATEKEREILEVNPCLFCFESTWLWENIGRLRNENAQEEYYLTDLIGMAVSQGKKISSIAVAPEEVIGINTQEERDIAEELLRKRYGKA